MRIRVRRAPTRLCLKHVTPQSHLTEDAAHRAGLIAAARVRQRLDRIVRGMEAAIALHAGNRMRTNRRCERILVTPAPRDHGLSLRPHEVVQDGAEPEPGSRLRDDPRTPTRHRPARFPKCATGLHQRAFASRVSAGWMTSSTSPYATASSGAMKRSRSMSFITCSSGWPEWREMSSAIRSAISRISLAAIWMSAGEPRNPPEPWWIITLAFGNTKRLPAAPPDRIIAAADMPIPVQIVWTSGRTYCMAS